LRTQVPVTIREGVTLFMPAYLPSVESLGAKIVSVFPKNIESDLPTLHALVILCNAKTGEPTAVMEGTYLTALRTGAASGVATGLLSLKDARTAAIIGAGIQGRTQLEAVCCTRDIQSVWVYDINHKAAEDFAEEMRNHGSPIPSEIIVAHSPAKAVSDADIICCATTSFLPVFEDDDLKLGTHINGVGSYTPNMQEIPEETILRSKVVVDSLSAALQEAGDLIIPLEKKLFSESHIHGEIGQVASGQIPGRESDEEITLFKSVGVAVQDVAVAELVLRQTRDLSYGTEIDL
jgi:ornithine cyclodeaminase/alanine dehydrogenase-like protein (mu-crystallin family)